MPIPITAFFAGLLTIFALVLSARAGSFRGKAGVSILYGEPINQELAVRVRVHQNFLEYVPLLLLLMAAIELSGGSSTLSLRRRRFATDLARGSRHRTEVRQHVSPWPFYRRRRNRVAIAGHGNLRNLAQYCSALST